MNVLSDLSSLQSSQRARPMEVSMAERTLHDLAFPTLDDESMASIAKVAHSQHFDDGQTLFQAGESDNKFFVLKNGKVEVIDVTGDEPKVIAAHGPRQFTGDISHLTGNPAIVSGVCRGGCDAYAICDDDLQRVASGQRSPERHHSPGVYRPAATPGRVAGFCRTAHHRVEVQPGYASNSRFPGEKSCPDHLSRPGAGKGRGYALEAIQSKNRGHADCRVRRNAGAAKSFKPGAR